LSPESNVERESRTPGDGRGAPPAPKIEMSLPDDPSRVPHDPPNPGPAPVITEDETPRDAVFLTEAQELRARIDSIGIGIVALNLMVGALLVIAAVHIAKQVPKPE
jgi:hypothetical protein